MRNRIKTKTREFINAQSEEVTLPKDEVISQNEEQELQTAEGQGLQAVEEQSVTTDDVTDLDVQAEDTTAPEVASDDSWLDELTVYEPEQQVPQEEPRSYQPQPAEAYSQAEDEHYVDEQRLSAAQLHAELEHIDDDVADEIRNKIFGPEIKRLQAKIAELEGYRTKEQEARRNALLVSVNNEIYSHYSKAHVDKILSSTDFKKFINLNNNPYSSDTGEDILRRAYYAGDAKYVLEKLDEFKDYMKTRGKPKPQVGVEPQQGRGRSEVAEERRGKPMTDAEYLAKRQAIRSAPRGTYPRHALKDLYDEYVKSNRG